MQPNIFPLTCVLDFKLYFISIFLTNHIWNIETKGIEFTNCGKFLKQLKNLAQLEPYMYSMYKQS